VPTVKVTACEESIREVSPDFTIDLTKISVDEELTATPPPPIPHAAPDTVLHEVDEGATTTVAAEIQA
jgi:hypothetical protein